MNKKYGIDVSKWQGNIDWSKVKSDGVEFVILRDGFGRTNIDSRFNEYVNGCVDVDIEIRGVYHFSYAHTVEQAKAEARFCVDNIKNSGLKVNENFVVFFDLEYDTINNAKKHNVTIGRAECIAHTNAFCSEVKRLGYTPGVYFNMHYYRTMYDAFTLDKYVNWLADWTGAPDLEVPYHQFSSEGKIDGINGNVDLNYFYYKEAEKEIPPVSCLSMDDITIQVIKGIWGNNPIRKEALLKAGYDAKAVQMNVNKIDTMARNVMDGKYGNDPERSVRLTEKGYDPKVIQEIVNFYMQ